MSQVCFDLVHMSHSKWQKIETFLGKVCGIPINCCKMLERFIALFLSLKGTVPKKL